MSEDDLRAALEDQRTRVAKELKRYRDDEDQLTLDFDAEERRQVETNMRSWDTASSSTTGTWSMSRTASRGFTRSAHVASSLSVWSTSGRRRTNDGEAGSPRRGSPRVARICPARRTRRVGSCPGSSRSGPAAQRLGGAAPPPSSAWRNEGCPRNPSRYRSSPSSSRSLDPSLVGPFPPRATPGRTNPGPERRGSRPTGLWRDPQSRHRRP